MGRPLYRFISVGQSIEATAMALGKRRELVADTFNQITHGAALQIHMQGFQAQRHILESIFERVENPLEALLYTAIAGDSAHFMTTVVKYMIKTVPQYRSFIDLPPPKAWSLEHITALRSPNTEEQAQHYDRCFSKITPIFKPFLQDVTNRQLFTDLHYALMEYRPDEITAIAMIAAV